MCSWMRSQYNPKIHTLYTPINIEKYRGNVPLVMRSRAEFKFAEWCDRNPNIVWWSSENIKIPYYHPIKKKLVNYWPDFVICVHSKVYIIELKPEKQTVAPKYSKRKSLIQEQATYLVNRSKWRAAKEHCTKLGYSFMVVTNESIYKK